MAKEQTGLWIPITILYNPLLSAAERVLAAEIKALDKGKGCFASNAHLARVIGVKDRRLRDILTDMIDRGMLRSLNRSSRKRRLFVTALCESGTAPVRYQDDDCDTSFEELSSSSPTDDQPAEIDRNAGSASSVETRQESAGNPASKSLVEDVDGTNYADRHSSDRTIVPAVSSSNAAGMRQDTRRECATENTVRRQVENNERKGERGFPSNLPAHLWDEFEFMRGHSGRSVTDRQRIGYFATLDNLWCEGYDISKVLAYNIEAGGPAIRAFESHRGVMGRPSIDLWGDKVIYE